MSYTKGKRGGNRHKDGDRKQPPFVALTWTMLNSPAYKKLTHSAGHALPYFLGKVKLVYSDPQRYQNEFTFSYAEGKRYGFAIATFSNIIQELIRKGFIDPVDKGGMKSDCKSYNVFRLSRRWEEYGKEGFQPIEWKCFQPKPRLKATPEMEMHSIRNGNRTGIKGPDISKTDAVGAEIG
ncbi:MAG: hypothetical protein WA666_07135 [Nitrospirota bacterium]